MSLLSNEKPEPVSQDPPDLKVYRNYLLMLARTSLPRELQGRLDASDVVQETLLEAHRQWENCRATNYERIAAWLRQILAGRIADAWRAQHCEKRDLGRERQIAKRVDESQLQLAELCPVLDSTPSMKVVRTERLLMLADAMASLPENQRLALQMRYCDGHSIADISEKTGKSVTAIAGLIKRAMASLRERFDGDEN